MYIARTVLGTVFWAVPRRWRWGWCGGQDEQMQEWNPVCG